MIPQTLIKDTDYAKALDTLGFCVVPLFTPAQIEQLRELYNRYAIDNKVSGLIASHSKSPAEQSKKVSNQIGHIVAPALQTSFHSFNFFMAGFMVKEGHTPGKLPLHQDWNILDESLATSYQVWIPLDLSHPQNGGMFVLPGSHRFFNNYRSGSYGIPTVDADDLLKDMLVNMIIPPGSALVFHNSLFHASYPNHSDANRISAIVSICQKDAPLAYYHKNTGENRTDVYGINSDIFLQSLNKLENGGVPDAPLYHQTAPVNTVENDKITAAQLAAGFTKYFKDDAKGFEALQLHIMRDESLERKMWRDGYAVADLLSEKEVAELKQEYITRFGTPHTAIGRFTAMEHTTPAARKSIHNFLLEKAGPALDKFFKDYQTPIASYFTKYARSSGDLTWHTDASLLLNTHLEPHYGIWCPLIDVSAQNGALTVIECSHKFSHAVFLGGLQWPYLGYTAMFDKRKKVFNLKAGQMVVFDMRLVHHSTPNDSDTDRICFAARLTHKKSKFYSFLCEEEDKNVVSVFEENSDVYLTDEWTGANQVVGVHNRVGKLQNIYAEIDFAGIENRLAEDTLHLA